MRLRTFFLILAASILLGSCCSLCDPVYVEPDPIVFSPKPGKVVLVEDPNVNQYMLMVQDIRWLMWAVYAEWKAGIVDKEEYDADMKRYGEIIDGYDEVFNRYQIYLDTGVFPDQ